MKFRDYAPIALLALSACAGNPKPPTPTPPPSRTVAVVVAAPDGLSRVTGATVYLDNMGNGTTCLTDTEGICNFIYPVSMNLTFLTVSAPGYVLYRQDGIAVPITNVQVWVGPGSTQANAINLPALTPILTDLAHLVINGRVFMLATGEQFYPKFDDCYVCFQMWLDGKRDAVKALFAQKALAGVNMTRVFGMYDNPNGIGHFRPEDYGPSYWVERKSFFDAAAAKKIYIQWTQFADASQFGCNIQQSLAENSIHAFDDITNVGVFEWINEADQPINKMCPNIPMPRIHGVLTSAGSNGSQSWPVTPFLDVLTWHSNNALEEERKLAHNCYEIQPSIPCLTNESSKAGAGKNWTVHPLAFAFDAWKACKLLNAGCNFHSVEGMKGEPYTEEHLDWLRETIRGIDSLPSSCQNLPYVHRQDLEPPGIIRAYQGDARADCLVQIRRSTL
jgi:hypothetical protein